MSPWRATAVLALAIAATACGSPHDARSSDAAIRAVVLRSYHTTDVRDCERVFTPSFIQLTFNGPAACRRHIELLARQPPRTVSIVAIRRRGPVADARIRVDSYDETVKLVLSGGHWLVDDSVGASGSAKQNVSQSRAAATARRQADAPLPLGVTARFQPFVSVADVSHVVSLTTNCPDMFGDRTSSFRSIAAAPAAPFLARAVSTFVPMRISRATSTMSGSFQCVLRPTSFPLRKTVTSSSAVAINCASRASKATVNVF